MSYDPPATVALRNAAPSLIATAREVEGLRAEVARYRTALGKIAKPSFNCMPHQYAMAMMAVAEDALEGKGG